MVRFLRIDLMVSGSNPPSVNLSPAVRRVACSVIPGVGITRCSHVEQKDLDIARLISKKLLSVQMWALLNHGN